MEEIEGKTEEVRQGGECNLCTWFIRKRSLWALGLIFSNLPLERRHVLVVKVFVEGLRREGAGALDQERKPVLRPVDGRFMVLQHVEQDVRERLRGPPLSGLREVLLLLLLVVDRRRSGILFTFGPGVESFDFHGVLVNVVAVVRFSFFFFFFFLLSFVLLFFCRIGT